MTCAAYWPVEPCTRHCIALEAVCTNDDVDAAVLDIFDNFWVTEKVAELYWEKFGRLLTGRVQLLTLVGITDGREVGTLDTRTVG